MKYTEEKAYAKINLYLEVYGKNSEGYHLLETVMQSISLGDSLNVGFSAQKETEIVISSDSKYLTLGKNNTCYKAAEMFFKKTGLSGRAEIDIRKIVPWAAGLGGGSADAAAVIIALDRLCATALKKEELCSIGKSVGADVPFCIRKGAALCKGTGDEFYTCKGLPPYTYIIIGKGKRGSSTQQAYLSLDKMKERVTFPEGCRKIISALEHEDLSEIGSSLYNAFEKIILPENPEVATIRRIMLVCGACGALMSGSGSAVFGLFKDKEKGDRAFRTLYKKGYHVYTCEPVAEV